MKLTESQTDCLKLVIRSQNIGDGWRQCSVHTYNFITEHLPEELLEKDSECLRVRITDEGNIVCRWLT